MFPSPIKRGEMVLGTRVFLCPVLFKTFKIGEVAEKRVDNSKYLN